MQKYEKYKEAIKPLKRLILADAATVFVRIEKEEEKIHKKVLSAESSLQKLAAMSEKEKEDEKIKKKISAAEKKIEEAKRKEKEFCIAVKPMYAAIADVIEHQKERPMTLWFEILDDDIAAAHGAKVEEHVVYATCVVKVTKENFAGQEGLDKSVQKMIAEGKFGERYFALIKRPEAGDKKEYEFLEVKKGWRPENEVSTPMRCIAPIEVVSKTGQSSEKYLQELPIKGFVLEAVPLSSLEHKANELYVDRANKGLFTKPPIHWQMMPKEYFGLCFAFKARA